MRERGNWYRPFGKEHNDEGSLYVRHEMGWG
jgi:hypothetical protein